MKKNRLMFCLIFVFLLALLTSCRHSASTILEIEMTKNYDSSDPFIDEKLIYVSEDVDNINLNVSFQMEGGSGFLETADNETKQVVWSEAWSKDVANTDFTISLDDLKKEKEYVVRFTGMEIKYTKIAIASDSSLVNVRERPEKKSR